MTQVKTGFRFRDNNWRDICAGGFFVLVGFAVSAIARDYSIGEPSSPGPGFFPFWLGVVLSLLGLMIVAVAVANGPLDGKAERVEARGIVGILGPVIVFGALLDFLGLVLSTVLLVILSSMASREFDLRASLLNAGILAAIVFVSFAYILQVQIPVWPMLLRPN